MITLIWIATKISVFMAIYGFIFSKLVKKPEAIWVKNRLLPISIVIFAAGVTLPSIWLYWMLLFLIIPTMARSASEAVCIFVLIIIVTPIASQPIAIGGIYILPFDKFLFAGLGLAASIMLHPIRGEKRVGWFDLPFLFFVILTFIEARGLNLTSTARTILGASTTLIIPYFVMSRSIRRPEDIKMLLFTVSFASFFLSLESLYEWKMGFLPYEFISQHLGSALSISSYSKQRSGGLRAATSFVESTSFGTFLVIGFMCILASQESFRSRRAQILSLIVILAGIYTTNARGPVLGLIICVLARDFYRQRINAMMGKIALLGVASLSILAIAQTSSAMSDRIGLSGGSTETTDYRKTLYRRGVEQIGKHPITGVSAAQTYAELSDLKQGEGIVDFVNAYIYYGMIAGVGGIILMLGLFYGIAIKIVQIRRRLKAIPGTLPAAGLVFCVAISTSVTAFTGGFGKANFIFFAILALGSSLAALARSRMTATLPRQEPARVELQAS